VQWSKPHSILAPLRIRTRAAGFKIISGDHCTTTAHSVEERDVLKINNDDDDEFLASIERYQISVQNL